MKKTLLFISAIGAAFVLAPISSASAVQLNGGWAPYNRCPVDHPDMLAAVYGVNVEASALCAATNSPNGSIKIGKLDPQETGRSNTQFGTLFREDGVEVIDGQGGSVQGEPTNIDGGLLGIIVPEQVPLAIREAVQDAIDNGPLGVTASVESAGPVTDFDLFAGIQVGEPIATVPIKIHLENPVLGDDCFIGSDEDPIVLRPEVKNADDQVLIFQAWDADGTLNPEGEFGELATEGSIQGDDTFAVPEADGCGPLGLGLLDGAINNRVGLPSPSGNNELVLNDVRSGISGLLFPEEGDPVGQLVHDAWHSAVLP